jgi:hypothetical protein
VTNGEQNRDGSCNGIRMYIRPLKKVPR